MYLPCSNVYFPIKMSDFSSVKREMILFSDVITDFRLSFNVTILIKCESRRPALFCDYLILSLTASICKDFFLASVTVNGEWFSLRQCHIRHIIAAFLSPKIFLLVFHFLHFLNYLHAFEKENPLCSRIQRISTIKNQRSFSICW